MISSFKVEGFKSLVIEEPLQLGRVNVLIGSNGSGKSNFLEAIGVLGAAVFGSVEPETLRYRGVRLGLPALYKTSLKEQRFRRLITMEASSAGASYRVGLDNPINAPNTKWTIASEQLLQDDRPILTRSPRGCRLHDAAGHAERASAVADQTLVKLSLARRSDAIAARELVEDISNFAIYSPNTPTLRGIAQEEISRDPLGINGGGLPDAVRHLLNSPRGTFGNLFDLEDLWDYIDWATDISAVSSSEAPVAPSVKTTPSVLRFTDRYMRKERNLLSAYDASEGALYVLFMLTLLCHEKAPRVFAVDNFDHALHPRLASELTRLLANTILSNGNRQMFVTTHNPLVLDGLDLAKDDIRLFAVDRGEAGDTRIRRVQITADLINEADKGLSLSRLWLMGRLGGIPKNL